MALALFQELGLQLNVKISALSHVQKILFIGTTLDLFTARAYLPLNIHNFLDSGRVNSGELLNHNKVLSSAPGKKKWVVSTH